MLMVFEKTNYCLFFAAIFWIHHMDAIFSIPIFFGGPQEQRSNASLELQRKQQLELIHSQAQLRSYVK